MFYPNTCCVLTKLGLKKLFVFLGLMLFCIPSNWAQQRTRDSLHNEINQLKAKSSFSKNDSTYINLLSELGSSIRYLNTDSVLIISKEVYEYSKLADYPKGKVAALGLIGNYYSDRGDNPDAIHHYKKAYEIAKELNSNPQMLRFLNDIAGAYEYQGDYAKALDKYMSGILLATKVKDSIMLSIMNENIANLYSSQHDYKQALEFYEKVKFINNKLGDKIFTAETNANLASLYADAGNYDYAMFHANKSISVFEKAKILDWLAYAYEVKGKVYLKQEKYKWALHWYNQSDLLHKKIEDKRGQIDLYNGMAQAYHGLNKNDLAKTHAQRAFQISNEINSIEGKQQCAKTLYQIYKEKEQHTEALAFHELFQHLSDTLSRDENKKSLGMLQTEMIYQKRQEQLVLENEKKLAQQQNYINLAIVAIFIFIVALLVRRKIDRKQKKFNAVLKTKASILRKRELELKEMNRTKDKMFSIIGHDLRSPIGAFQGILRLFNDKEMSGEEFLEQIPKLSQDVNHIAFTLNNLLSWGHTQMKGAVTKPSLVALDNLVIDNINLLSEVANHKSLKIVNKICPNTLIWSDANQIDVVIRNLISNALKFTSEKGMITIEATEKNKHWEVSIRDTGVGMDLETQSKIFAKNENFTTYGTNSEKGTGLGLSLCKEMVEKNNGTIWVESTVNRGSCFYFTLPKAERAYKKTA